jgi:hypothetical protein
MVDERKPKRPDLGVQEDLVQLRAYKRDGKYLTPGHFETEGLWREYHRMWLEPLEGPLPPLERSKVITVRGKKRVLTWGPDGKLKSNKPYEEGG